MIKSFLISMSSLTNQRNQPKANFRQLYAPPLKHLMRVYMFWGLDITDKFGFNWFVCLSYCQK